MKHKANVDRIIEGFAADAKASAEAPRTTWTHPLAGPVYTDSKLPAKCGTCSRDPAEMNSAISECSHVDCPHRGRSWCGGTGRAPWRKPAKSTDPRDGLFDKAEV